MATVIVMISLIRLVPHLIVYATHKNRSVIRADLDRFVEVYKYAGRLQFVHYMTFLPEFRNIFYYRIGAISGLIRWLCPEMNTLFIYAGQIGPGLFIQHGFATIIGAKSIGARCWINQQVTIGYTNATDAPTLGDDVFIRAGAKILGNVHMGDKSEAGANAVVVKSVPSGCTVVGVPAYIVRRNGVQVRESL